MPAGHTLLATLPSVSGPRVQSEYGTFDRGLQHFSCTPSREPGAPASSVRRPPLASGPDIPVGDYLQADRGPQQSGSARLSSALPKIERSHPWSRSA